MAKIRFWRLQEVEVPFRDGIDVEAAIEAIDENDSFFDTDDLDWDKEIVVEEDYSGATDNYGLYFNGKLINDYHSGNCETWVYRDKGEREWSKKLIARLDHIKRK
jgi:hypothetical protein